MKRKSQSIRRFGKILFGILLCAMIWSGLALADDELRLVPFDQDQAALLLQRTVEAKLIPYTMENDGLKLTITRLLRFKMDWEKAQFSLGCAFTADYDKFFSFKDSGEVYLTGTGLIAPAEQRLGVKLLKIDGLKLEHTGSMLAEAARFGLDKGFAGKEFWQGKAPAPETSEAMTRDNFGALLMVALNQQMPLSGSNGDTSFTLTQVNSLTMLPEPGYFEVRLSVKGNHRALLTLPYEGQAEARAFVQVDPWQLAGIIRMEGLTDLRLKNTPGFLSDIVRGMVNNKLKGRETRFSWK